MEQMMGTPKYVQALWYTVSEVVKKTAVGVGYSRAYEMMQDLW